MTKEDVIKEFSSLKGVGKAKAELLYENGFTSMEKLKKASVKDLTKVKGINEKLAKEIKNQLSGKKTEKKEEKTKTKKSKKEYEEAKKEKEPEEKPEPEKEVEEEKVEIVEEEKKEYKAKIKPELNESLKKRLLIRKRIKNRTPEFLRQEWFRYKRIPKNWRRPRGMTSKLRKHLGYRPSVVRVGFRGPKETRGLHPSGFEEVLVYNARDLEKLNPKTQAARIGGSVGTKKRVEIKKKAEDLGLRILNL
ncbi:MAG: 50S ribosomal protein L32e [Candidatus Thermoplasmatota archaeon]|jgi:large subunit ribosomal protein L32e|nr:50S ribosomal protein L32e [Candidatus Thermoplasmatota archaeon]